MAIAFINKGAFNSGTGTVALTLPSGYAPGDLLILVANSASQTVTAPSGWTIATIISGTGGRINTTGGAVGSTSIFVFYRIATGSESGPTVADSGDHTAGIILAYSGVDQTLPLEAQSQADDGTTTSTTATWNAVTTLGPNRLIVLMTGLGLDAASTTTTSGYTNANLTGITERHDQTVTDGVGGGFAIADGLAAATGSIGTSTATTTSATHVNIGLALKPSGAPALSAPTATSITTTTATPQVALAF